MVEIVGNVPLADILVQHIDDAQSLMSGSAVYLIGGGGLSCNGTEREGASRVEPSNTAMLSILKVFAGATVFSTKPPPGMIGATCQLAAIPSNASRICTILPPGFLNWIGDDVRVDAKVSAVMQVLQRLIGNTPEIDV